MLSYLTGEVPCPTNTAIIFSGRLVILDANLRAREVNKVIGTQYIVLRCQYLPRCQVESGLADKSEREIYYKGALANTCCDV